LATTDQPLVELSWTNGKSDKYRYSSDLGCPSFAARIRKLDILFVELLKKGQLGQSKLLTVKKNRPTLGIE
jgi:hypothetical protein